MASKAFNYSKWDHIELSDDESDCHPNIDKESWFRMKHRSRLEREEKEDKEIAEMERLTTDDLQRLKIIHARIKAIRSGELADEADVDDIEGLQGEADELTSKVADRNSKIAKYKEARMWNIDNICKVTEERSVLNQNTAMSLRAEDFTPTGATAQKFGKDVVGLEDEDENVVTPPPPPSTVPVAGDAAVSGGGAAASAAKKAPMAPKASTASVAVGPVAPERMSREKLSVISYNDFVLAHEDLLEQYSEVHSMDDSKEMLFRNCDILLHEHAQSYMLLSCLEDEMNGKHKRMRHVGKQSQILSHINELGTSMKRDPRDVIIPFFKRLEEKPHLEGFQTAVEEFIQRIKKRAVEKRKEMDEEREAEELPPREVRLGPGGLDPIEVIEVLPPELRQAFESRSIEKLKSVVAAMSPQDAKKWMKMCVDSGLWVPQPGASLFDDEGEDSGDEATEAGDGGGDSV